MTAETNKADYDNRLRPITWADIPKSIEQRTLEAIERIEKMIAEYVLAQTHPKVVVPAQNTAPKPQGTKKR